MLYNPCPCGSAKKFKFCCCELMKSNDYEKIGKATASYSHQVLITKDWYSKGISSILLIKEIIPNQSYIISSYLVDTWCLGLKEAFIKKNASYYYVNALMQNPDFELIDYENARSIILGAIEYANALSLAPHKDWEITKHFIEYNRPFNNKYTFGFEGKPFYSPGPYDLEERNVPEIISKVVAKGGHYMMML